jgi:hypothetical protein
MPQVVLFLAAVGYALSGPVWALVGLRRWRRAERAAAAA